MAGGRDPNLHDKSSSEQSGKDHVAHLGVAMAAGVIGYRRAVIFLSNTALSMYGWLETTLRPRVEEKTLNAYVLLDATKSIAWVIIQDKSNMHKERSGRSRCSTIDQIAWWNTSVHQERRA